jgi:hypothetical protein
MELGLLGDGAMLERPLTLRTLEGRHVWMSALRAAGLCVKYSNTTDKARRTPDGQPWLFPSGHASQKSRAMADPCVLCKTAADQSLEDLVRVSCTEGCECVVHRDCFVEGIEKVCRKPSRNNLRRFETKKNIADFDGAPCPL